MTTEAQHPLTLHKTKAEGVYVLTRNDIDNYFTNVTVNFINKLVCEGRTFKHTLFQVTYSGYVSDEIVYHPNPEIKTQLDITYYSGCRRMLGPHDESLEEMALAM